MSRTRCLELKGSGLLSRCTTLRLMMIGIARFTHTHGAANAELAHDPKQLNEQLLTQGGPIEDIIGPIAVSRIQGKGRGLVAKRALKIGDLLLKVQPLAFLASPPTPSLDLEEQNEDLPDPLLLVQQLLDKQSNISPLAWRAAWLRLLHKGLQGDLASGRADATQLKLLMAAGPTGVLPEGHAGLKIHEEDVQAVVSYNAFGDRFDDPVAAAARSETHLSSSQSGAGRVGLAAVPAMAGHVGVWPQFSLLNHSCLPNAVHYTIGNTLIVRATQALQPGEEICVSYLGTEDHAPTGMRRKVLEERYGFICSCPRCLLEDGINPELTKLLHDLYWDVKHNLMPLFVASMEDEDRLDEVGKHMKIWYEKLYQHLEEFISSGVARSFAPHRINLKADGVDMLGLPDVGGPTHAVLCLQASVYEFFQLALLYNEAADEAADADLTASLQNCIQIMDAVNRGSELHTFLSARVLFKELQSARQLTPEQTTGKGDEAEDGGPRHVASREDVVHATRIFNLAHLARYGELPTERMIMLSRLSYEIGKRYM